MEPMSALVELRTFRAMMDGPTFCWDLHLVQTVGSGDDLPYELSSLAGAVDEAVEGEGAFDGKKNRTDRIFVSATTARGGLDAEDDDELPGGPAKWLDEAPGWMRYVKLTAKPGGCELVWCVRVEGGPEVAEAIARAWQGWSRVVLTPGQQPLPMETPKKRDDDVIKLQPRKRSSTTEKRS